jgi:hypothetical protein
VGGYGRLTVWTNWGDALQVGSWIKNTQKRWKLVRLTSRDTDLSAKVAEAADAGALVLIEDFRDTDNLDFLPGTSQPRIPSRRALHSGIDHAARGPKTKTTGRCFGLECSAVVSTSRPRSGRRFDCRAVSAERRGAGAEEIGSRRVPSRPRAEPSRSLGRIPADHHDWLAQPSVPGPQGLSRAFAAWVGWLAWL